MRDTDSESGRPNPIPCGTYDDCVGCSACSAICPRNCISMQPNNEGFLFPVVDSSSCAACGLCRKICPVVKAKESGAVADGSAGRQPLSVHAAWNLASDIRKDSTSGGMFTALSERILFDGGLVVGAAFGDGMAVRHIIVENENELYRLRGSKYVQSELSVDVLKGIRDALENGRVVLFSGTPCQVAGLRAFLRRDYDNLYCCDIVCMGTPSPLLLSSYVSWLAWRRRSEPESMMFREKSKGWKVPSVYIRFSDGSILRERSVDNSYYLAFGRRFALRESCYDCRFKGLSRSGDITMGDFWGVDKTYPEYDAMDEGTSLVFVNSEKGRRLLGMVSDRVFLGPADVRTAVASNPMILQSASRPQTRDGFYGFLKRESFGGAVRRFRLRRRGKFLSLLDRIRKHLFKHAD